MNNEYQWDTDIDNVFDSFPEIETERLLLRCLEPVDAEAVFQVFSDSDVTRYYDLETIHDIDEAQGLIDFFVECFDLEKAIRWGIVRKEDNVLMGTCGYVWLRRFRGEIGYELAKPYWRKGYMTEALDAILDFGYDDLKMNRIEALVMVNNQASAGLLEKLGFTQEAVLREYDYFKGAFHDMRLYSMLKTDFYDND